MHVLTTVLTGGRGRDHPTNRLLLLCRSGGSGGCDCRWSRRLWLGGWSGSLGWVHVCMITYNVHSVPNNRETFPPLMEYTKKQLEDIVHNYLLECPHAGFNNHKHCCYSCCTVRLNPRHFVLMTASFVSLTAHSRTTQGYVHNHIHGH